MKKPNDNPNSFDYFRKNIPIIPAPFSCVRRQGTMYWNLKLNVLRFQFNENVFSKKTGKTLLESSGTLYLCYAIAL